LVGDHLIVFVSLREARCMVFIIAVEVSAENPGREYS